MKRLKARYGCPVELSLAILGGKWKVVILALLKDGPLRYGELRALVPGLSDKMLSERLRDLHAVGLVAVASAEEERRAYALTARGESLRPVLQALYDWGTDAAAIDGIAIERAP
ncbi:winged helix-turn-helix transcriptional regulator [Methylobacterium sp. JK268]